MDIDTDDDILRTLSEGKSMNYEQWPGLLSRLIERLDNIVKNEFPPVSYTPPQPFQTQSTQIAETSSQRSTLSDDSTNKENAPPPQPAPEPDSNILPPPIQDLINSIIATLNTHFSKHPPHTIQRFAELISNPKQHYKNLPSYLHAVDRVVHVTSGANSFPLPPAVPDPSSISVLSNGNGTRLAIDPLSISWANATHQSSALGSDESLGGALLTPISWLSNRNGNGLGESGGSTHSPLEGEVTSESTEMVEGPNGLGGIETVTVSVNGISSTRENTSPPAVADADVIAGLRAEGGVSQGELIRQEQRANVVPATQLSGNRGDPDGMGEDDEMPHARGPEEIGMEDMGPQSAGSGWRGGGQKISMQGIDVEAAVGRKIDVKEDVKTREKEPEAPTTPKREAEEPLESAPKRTKEEIKEEETDTVDSEVKTEDEKKSSEEDEKKEPEAVDSSAV